MEALSGPSNFKVLAAEETPLGLLCLRRRESLQRPGLLITEITLNHQFLMSSYVTESERALARHALEMHTGTALNVLVGGLGLGYTAREVLLSERVARVEVVEFLPPVIGWLEQGLLPLSPELTSDARLTVVEGDVYARLSGDPARKFDLILIDVDHTPENNLGDSNADFYTEPGLRRAREHLAPEGVLAVWSYASHSPFSDALGRVFRDARTLPIRTVNDLVEDEHTDWLFLGRA